MADLRPIIIFGMICVHSSIGVARGLPDYQELSQRNLIMPISGVRPGDIRDTFKQSRPGGQAHEATDILAPRNTPILAMEEGVIQKLFLSKPGGLTIYEFDRDGTYCYYYAHLERYADGLKEGMRVKRGDVIGYVGTSGNALGKSPHLHLAIFKLGPQKRWWEGTPIDPYPLLIELLRADSHHSKST
jgi:murein DD-endopeptidase MepM/ murein hydrolase activator NlpD